MNKIYIAATGNNNYKHSYYNAIAIIMIISDCLEDSCNKHSSIKSDDCRFKESWPFCIFKACLNMHLMLSDIESMLQALHKAKKANTRQVLKDHYVARNHTERLYYSAKKMFQA